MTKDGDGQIPLDVLENRLASLHRTVESRGGKVPAKARGVAPPRRRSGATAAAVTERIRLGPGDYVEGTVEPYSPRRFNKLLKDCDSWGVSMGEATFIGPALKEDEWKAAQARTPAWAVRMKGVPEDVEARVNR